MKTLKSVVLSAVAASTLFGTTVTVPVTGWNLMGATSTINPYSTFNQANVRSVWAWNATDKKWIAYAPSGSSDFGGINTLATSNVISFFNSTGTISAGSGFWINTTAAVSYETNATTVPTVTAPTLSSTQPVNFAIAQDGSVSGYSFASHFSNTTTGTTIYSSTFAIPGITFASATGTVTGAPTTVGPYTGHITACNGTACVSTNNFTITVNSTTPTNYSAPYFYNLNMTNNIASLFVAKNTALDIDLAKYAKDNEGGTITVSASGSSSLPSNLSFSNGKITGTTSATTTGTLGVTLSDGTNTNTYTLNIVPIDPAIVNNDDNKTFVYGSDAISDVNLNNAMTFFEPDKNDDVPYLGVIALSTNSGIYNEYEFNGSTFNDTSSYNMPFNLSNKSTTSVDATFSDNSIEQFKVISAKNVTSINGVDTAGLKEATIEFKTLATSTVENSTDWWESHYSTWDQTTNSSVAITDLTTLKNTFITNAQYMDVWITEDTRVTLAGTTSSTAGNAIGMSWDGTYNQCTGTDCGSPYYKRMISTGTTVGTWSLDSNYLKVIVPNVGTTAFKIQNNQLMQTEIKAVNQIDTGKWYFGVDQTTFQNKFIQVENAY
jgi:hypothetical protein